MKLTFKMIAIACLPMMLFYGCQALAPNNVPVTPTQPVTPVVAPVVPTPPPVVAGTPTTQPVAVVPVAPPAPAVPVAVVPVQTVLTPTPLQNNIVGGISTTAAIVGAVPVYGGVIALGLSLLGNLLGGLWGVKANSTNTALTSGISNLITTVSSMHSTGSIVASTPAHADALQTALNTASSVVGTPAPTLATIPVKTVVG